MNERKDNAQLHNQYLNNHHVHIEDFLKADIAKELHAKLLAQRTWNLVWNNDGKHVDMNLEEVQRWPAEQRQQLASLVNQQARNRFQYFYASIPIYDVCKNNSDDHGFLREIYNFVNSHQFIGFARELTGRQDIKFADVQATRYSNGHFLKEHDDNVAGKGRVAAYVLNLTPTWQADWGGALILNCEQAHLAHALFPSHNALNVFEVPRRHSVSMVSPFANASRFSITGWFRT